MELKPHDPGTTFTFLTGLE